MYYLIGIAYLFLCKPVIIIFNNSNNGCQSCDNFFSSILNTVSYDTVSYSYYMIIDSPCSFMLLPV